MQLWVAFLLSLFFSLLGIVVAVEAVPLIRSKRRFLLLLLYLEEQALFVADYSYGAYVHVVVPEDGLESSNVMPPVFFK